MTGIPTDTEIQTVERSFGIKLTDWQKDYLRAMLSGKVISGGRRCGKSTVRQVAAQIHKNREATMSTEMQAGLMKEAIVAAATGERVLILGETMRSTDRIFNDVMHVLVAIPNSLLVHKATRANGNPRIDFADAGNIRFLSVRSTLRGYTFDRVYVPDMEHDENLKERIWWTTRTSQTGEVTGYGRTRADTDAEYAAWRKEREAT